MTDTTIAAGETRRVRAIRDLRALDADYSFADWKATGDVFEATYEGDLSHGWIALGPDGKGVGLWIGKDVEFAEGS